MVHNSLISIPIAIWNVIFLGVSMSWCLGDIDNNTLCLTVVSHITHSDNKMFMNSSAQFKSINLNMHKVCTKHKHNNNNNQ